jgi:hypothetical protein
MIKFVKFEKNQTIWFRQFQSKVKKETKFEDLNIQGALKKKMG